MATIDIVVQASSCLWVLQFIAIEHLFTDDRCTTVLMNGSAEARYLSAVEQLWHHSAPAPMIWMRDNLSDVDATQDHILTALNAGCVNFIVAADYFLPFYDGMMKAKDISQGRNRNRKFLLLIGQRYELNKEGKNFLSFHPDVLFIRCVDGIVAELYSNEYGGRNGHEVKQVNVYNRSSGMFASDTPIYVDKLKDMRGRNLTVATQDYQPYCNSMFVEPTTGNVDSFNGSRNVFYDGTDSTILLEFCVRRNCNPVVQVFGPNNWGFVDTEGNGSFGSIGSVYRRDTELTMCCSYPEWYYDSLDISHSYLKSTVVLMVPAAKKLSSNLTPMYPFSVKVWLTWLLTTIALAICHRAILKLLFNDIPSQRGPQIGWSASVFTMVRIYLGQTITIPSPKPSFRLFMAIILITQVVIDNSYSGGLASVLTVPRYEKSIDTIEDFARSPYRWGAPSYVWIYTIQYANNNVMPTIVERFDQKPAEEIYEKSLGEGYAVGIEMLNGGLYAFDTYVQENNVKKLHVMAEGLYFSMTAAYVQRGWPILEELNDFLLRMLSYGLNFYWEKQAVHTYFNQEVQTVLANPGANDVDKAEALNMDHVFGPFAMLFMGLAASCICFLCEVFIPQRRSLG